MRAANVLTTITMIGLLVLCGSRRPQSCTVSIVLTDAETGRELSGLVRITDAAGERIAVEGLLSRGIGLSSKLPIAHWFVLPGATDVQIPRGELIIEAFSGLETELATKTIDLTDKTTARIVIPLVRFYRAADSDYRSANTHLHLQKVSRQQCDRYLREIPKADGLDMVFLSYLERQGADKQYTSNDYTDGDLATLARVSGVVFGNGEEHRHNFAGFGEGYGHVMLLNIQRLIQPVSIGPGIMQMGTDGLPLQRGIDAAHRDGATVLWCHNSWGLEALPNLVNGKIDAQNIFDGGSRDSYKDSFYRYLNAGMRVPFSTGTDWFMYDLSRAYVRLNGELTVNNWLKNLAAGESYITNGPLFEFRVADRDIGDTVRLQRPSSVAVFGRVVGRVDFGQAELVHNGQVLKTSSTRSVDGHFEAKIETTVSMRSPGWLALRTPPPSVKEDPDLRAKTPLNEFGRELFAHTSPVFVEISGKALFDEGTARELLAEMETDRDTVQKQGKFADEQELARVLDVYGAGIAALQQRIQERTTTRAGK